MNREIQDAIGRSEAFIEFQQQLSRVSKVDRPVLLQGERGTGKELAARRIHFLSRRWNAPWVTLNCAAITSSLLSSELFGAEAGAYTGADKQRPGRFEAAHGGSLFLDELGHLPMEAQEKVLRAVEYGSFERLGSTEPVTVDVRLVGATHVDLRALRDAGLFKADLLDRLSFEVLFLPPLRERADDIPLLAHHFAGRMARELDLEGPCVFTPEAGQALLDHPWPGNVRELKNVVERALFRAEAPTIAREHIAFDPFPPEGSLPLPTEFREAAAQTAASAAPAKADAPSPLPCSLRDEVRELERKLLGQALERSRHKQRRAAELLGLTYHQFRALYRKNKDAISDS